MCPDGHRGFFPGELGLGIAEKGELPEGVDAHKLHPDCHWDAGGS